MDKVTNEKIIENKKYLELLANTYPDTTSATVEVVNLKAILNLPKGTEHFLTDIHGENEAFNHVMQNGSGAIQRKINEELGSTLDIESINELKTLIYYPKEKLEYVKKEKSGEILVNWYELTLYRLVKVCRAASSKYTRSKVRKALTKEFAYIIEELLQEDEHRENKREYYKEIIKSIVELGKADLFIREISSAIKRFTIDHLHILGDIFDRGPGPDKVMETLMSHHSIDVQWGNHDILWMGAAAGSRASICNVVRIALRYGNNDVLENAYGINLLPLATFAERTYDDNLKSFIPKNVTSSTTIDADTKLIAKMHKAISIIQFKIEENIIKNHPEYHMEDRMILSTIDKEKNTVKAYGKEYKLNNFIWPTIKNNSIELTQDEEHVMDKLYQSFVESEKLQRHIKFLFSKGSMYKTFNGNLLFHACLQLTEDGDFKEIEIDGKKYKGKALMDKFDQKAREAYFGDSESTTSPDFLWYLWCNPDSTLFGKEKMATFERYFIDDKETHKEALRPYYTLMKNDDGTIATKILKEFGIEDSEGRIVNGHTPVKLGKGEKPIRAGGKLLVIDGGFSKAYQKTTGIAGYTLTYNSYGLTLISHDPFESVESAIVDGFDIKSTKEVVAKTTNRKLVKDTDNGKKLIENIEELEMLIEAYKRGIIKQKI